MLSSQGREAFNQINQIKYKVFRSYIKQGKGITQTRVSFLASFRSFLDYVLIITYRKADVNTFYKLFSDYFYSTNILKITICDYFDCCNKQKYSK